LNNNPGGSQISHIKSDPNKKEIVETSLNVGVVSNYTSFIAVEVREEVDKVTQQCKLVEVPLQLPKKHKYESYGNECAMLSCASTGLSGMRSMSAQSGGFASASMSRGPVMAKGMSNSNSMWSKNAKSSSKSSSKSAKGGFKDCRFDSTAEKEDDEEEDCGEIVFDAPSYTIALTIDKFPTFTKIDNMLTGKGAFPFTVKENDYVSVTGEGLNNGVYKVYCLGSDSERWVLERVEKVGKVGGSFF